MQNKQKTLGDENVKRTKLLNEYNQTITIIGISIIRIYWPLSLIRLCLSLMFETHSRWTMVECSHCKHCLVKKTVSESKEYCYDESSFLFHDCGLTKMSESHKLKEKPMRLFNSIQFISNTITFPFNTKRVSENMRVNVSFVNKRLTCKKPIDKKNSANFGHSIRRNKKNQWD